MEYFKSTLVSKYIKYLLSLTPMPLYPIIYLGEYMVEGSKYVYKNKIVECTQGGIFMGDVSIPQKSDPKHLTPSDDLCVSDDISMEVLIGSEWIESYLTPTDNLVRFSSSGYFAKYNVVGDYVFGKVSQGINEVYSPNTSYYDGATHKFLGSYLRLLKTISNINLMPLYNCFGGEESTSFSLKPSNDGGYTIGGYNSATRVWLVPIRFNREYTIALDNLLSTLIYPVFYKGSLLTKKIEVEDNRPSTTFRTYDILDDNVFNVNGASFKNPIKIKITNTEKANQDFVDCLYLAIQVPNSVESTLIVLEGDFTNIGVTTISGDTNNSNNVSDVSRTSELSLLTQNDNRQHPFSEKLIEYLSQNTIDARTKNGFDIKLVEEMSSYNKGKIAESEWVWSNDLQNYLFDKYMALDSELQNVSKLDILGYVDSDVENALRRGLLKDAN